jgi:predicted permease
MQSLIQNLRFALRQLRRSPGFAITAVLTLALGIGANTAIFSLLDQALLRALPVEHPEQLVVLKGTGEVWEGSTHNHGGGVESYFSYPMYKDLRDRNQAFDGLLATAPADIGIAHDGNSQPGRAELVSGNYFNLLGVHAAAGRVFTQNDDLQPDANPVAVLSFEFWRDQFGASTSIVGQTVSVNGHPFQVVGVAAQGFHSAIWGETPNLFVPINMLDTVIPGKGKRLALHTDRGINLIGRLKHGESIAQAEATLAPLWYSLRAAELKALGIQSKRFTDSFVTNSRLLLSSGQRGFSYQRDTFQKPLLAVMAMAVLVLLIACVNVASLLLVRAAGRTREFSLRFALGANVGNIVAQLLLEGLLVGLAGGIAGMVLTPFAIRALVHQLAGDEAQVAFNSSIDIRVLAFNFAAALAASLLFSLAPMAQLRRRDLTAAIGQKGATGTGSMLSLRGSIVSLQIGLSVLLLVAAGLFVRTMQNLRHVDVGFTTSHLIGFGINPKLAGYQTAAVPALQQRVLDTLTVLPGIQAVAATDDPELANNDHGGNVTVAGYNPPPDESFDVEEPFVNPGFFSALQIPLLAGRAFTDTDAEGNARVGIVNEAFARHFCGSVNACIGRMMASGGGNSVKLDVQIVGVARDAKHTGIREIALPTWFRPMKQNPSPAETFFYLRTQADPVAAIAMVRKSMQQLDPALPLTALRTMDAQIDDNLSNDRMVTLLAIAFGFLAAVLAGVGIYGVLAYSTAQRTREIGIRIALGSSRTAVAGLVLSGVLRLVLIAIAIALPIALGLTHFVRSQLFGVSAADPVTLLAVLALISVIAVLASLVPAGRAASVDPTEALRTE